MPYRSRKPKPKTARAEAGLVAEMVEQFADRYACVRELVQNAIDAGASRVDVTAEHVDGRARLEVRDDGAGMTRDLIEGPLLTVFSSAKEGVEGKIGKYGIGFISVFALEPDEVVVSTWRPEGSWDLKLAPDHSFELAEGRGRPRAESGTLVAIGKTMDGDAFEQLAASARDALSRWCRHAAVPIRWRERRPSGVTEPVRIDEPFGLDAPAQIEKRDDDAHYVVGAVGTGDTFAGFYNHGLTLFETTQAVVPELDGLHVKVMSDRLAHTLSRDGVVHDDQYREVVRRIAELARQLLCDELLNRLNEAAEGVVAAPHDDQVSAVYETLLRAAECNILAMGNSGLLPVPLSAPWFGQRVSTLAGVSDKGTVYYARRPDLQAQSSGLWGNALALMASSGRAVLIVTGDEVLALLRARASLSYVFHHYLIAEELEAGNLSQGDLALCSALRVAVGKTGAKVKTVAFALRRGAHVRQIAVVVDKVSSSGRYLLCKNELDTWHSRWRTRARLLVFTSSPGVADARRLAARDPVAAAQLLVRLMLSEEPEALSAGRNDDLLLLAARTRTRARHALQNETQKSGSGRKKRAKKTKKSARRKR